MILDKKKNCVVIGYDLGRKYAQISYAVSAEEEPMTLSTVAGSEQFTIPVVLCKRYEVNQWFYGKEAIKKAEEGEGILVDDLLELAVKGVPVTVGEESFEPASLLALFMKRSLSLLSMVTALDKINVFMITVNALNQRMAEVLAACVEALQLKTKSVFFQNHVESVYQYMIHQPRELWHYQTLVCEFSYDGLITYRMEYNRRTTPMVAYIDTKTYGEFGDMKKEELDHAFLKVLEDTCSGRIISAAYLIGEGFAGDWNKEALQYLCRNRRVFQGNNLYSKGACYSAREKWQESENAKELIFLGNDKLKANLGMRVLRRGEESYFALLNAGMNWFEAKKECEFILESGNSFSILITPVTGGDKREVEMILEGLPERKKKMTRLRLSAKLLSEDQLIIEIEDLGFGEILPPGNLKWREVFAL